ncbi:MAG: carbohydrate binding family 9 domain-containing protein, partial [Gemmatimonadetes bacterium]|nr:carbohydrate binding family 9 domain-containing protein [Gemmatimonadota bacterium]
MWLPQTLDVHLQSSIRGLAVLALCALSAGAADSNSEIAAVRLEAPPTIDGRLDDAVWQSAARVEGFTQVEPFHGEPSPVATTVLLGYDEEALYVAFDCRDDDTSRIAASVTTRDGVAGRDDIVAVMLDTFHDGDSAYYFATNLLGTQFDGTVANNGRTIDDQWDAAWTNASAATETGWAAEFRIPFGILRYASGEKANWGINFLREHPRRLEKSVWAGPGESEWRVSAFAALTSWSPPRGTSKWWQVLPYVIGVVAEGGENEGEVGGDLRLRYRSALIADLTLNPDFALVEADVEQINLTRFELFISEKRPFFLEGNERFDQRMQQFYSRRIGDIDWGAKVAGTVGAFDFIALGTRAELPVEREELESILDAGYGVFRLQRAVMGSGNVGLLAASRDFDGESAGSVGLDTTLFFTETLGMTGQYLRTHGPGESGTAWFLRPAYDSASTHFHVRYTNLDPGIRDDVNAVGFLRDDNRREWDTNFTHSWWFEDSAVEKLRAGINYNRYEGHDGVLRSYETDLSARVDFTNRWQLRLGYEDSFERFEEDFHNEIAQIEIGYDNREGRSFEVEVARGRNFGDDLWLWEGELTFKVSDAWNLGYEVTRLDLEPDPRDRSTTIQVLRTTYYFTNDLYMKLFAQTNSAIDKENVQLLGVWRILPPFGSLQVAY